MKVSYKRLTLGLPMAALLWLKRRMRYVRAAGGVVEDEEGHRLLIRRNGRWDLPKGKVEAGESLAQAALREVEEETGLACRLGHPVPVKTYHVYHLYGGWHLKQTSWFAMKVAGSRPAATPQAEEGITAAEWVGTAEWSRRLEGSYGTLKTLSRRWTR